MFRGLGFRGLSRDWGHVCFNSCWGGGYSRAYIIERRSKGVYTVARKMHQAKKLFTLRVHVLNNHILTLNLYYNYYYQNPKYFILGYLDPLSEASRVVGGSWCRAIPP